MRTFSATPRDIKHQWFVVDAEGMVLGRLKTGVVAASDPAVPAPARSRRTKTRRGA